MAEPSKTFAVIPDGDVDAESPLDTDLLTAIRDALIHLEEWAGKNFTAAVDHDHDGVNSAFVSSVLKTEQSTTSGTSKSFTGITSAAKKITVMLAGVSINGTSGIEIQLGDSGGFETSGYSGAVSNAAAGGNHSSGFRLYITATAAAVLHGSVTLTLEDSANDTWVAAVNIGHSNDTNVVVGGGSKSLTGTLTQVRIKSVNGTDAFDAGAVNVLIET